MQRRYIWGTWMRRKCAADYLGITEHKQPSQPTFGYSLFLNRAHLHHEVLSQVHFPCTWWWFGEWSAKRLVSDCLENHSSHIYSWDASQSMFLYSHCVIDDNIFINWYYMNELHACYTHAGWTLATGALTHIRKDHFCFKFFHFVYVMCTYLCTH